MHHDLQPLAPTLPNGNPGTVAVLARTLDMNYTMTLATNVHYHIDVNTRAAVGVVEY